MLPIIPNVAFISFVIGILTSPTNGSNIMFCPCEITACQFTFGLEFLDFIHVINKEL